MITPFNPTLRKRQFEQLVKITEEFVGGQISRVYYGARQKERYPTDDSSLFRTFVINTKVSFELFTSKHT